MGISNEIREIPLKEIELSKLNVRVTDKNVGIDELAESIKKYGLLQPVILKGEYGKPPYELIVGQRRFLAHKLLKEKKIRAVFCEEDNEMKLRMLSLSENMHRAELNYSDKADAITLLYKELGRNAKKVAAELGISVPTVIEYVKLEEQATAKAKDLLKRKSIKKADVKRAISAAQGDPAKIDKLLDELPKLTRYEKDRAVNYGRKEKATVEKIIEEAKKPKLERTVILNLNQDTDDALKRAGEKLAMDREEIAALALEEWLKENGFWV
jgi:ParB family chromosome partitioning protein